MSKLHLILQLATIWLLLSPVSYAIFDTNGNGVSDLWEKHYNDGNLFSTFDPNADPDGDGWTNEIEAISGTNPSDGNLPSGYVRPVITHIPAVYTTDASGAPAIFTPEAITITWPTLIGKQYTLLSSADFTAGSWIAVDDPETGTGEEMGAGFSLDPSEGGTSPSMFLRVAINDFDSDGEGLTDHEEEQLNTNPHSADTDQDGVNDLSEIQQETNPHIPRIWGFREVTNSDGSVTYTWNSHAEDGDWFKVEKLQSDDTWKTVYSTTYGSSRLPFVPGIVSYSLTLDPTTDYLP
jgi:hypothetical protein